MRGANAMVCVEEIERKTVQKSTLDPPFFFRQYLAEKPRSERTITVINVCAKTLAGRNKTKL